MEVILSVDSFEVAFSHSILFIWIERYIIQRSDAVVETSGHGPSFDVSLELASILVQVLILYFMVETTLEHCVLGWA